MKNYFDVGIHLLEDHPEFVKYAIKETAYGCHLPLPLEVKIYREHADNFVRNVATIVITSMALIKYRE